MLKRVFVTAWPISSHKWSLIRVSFAVDRLVSGLTRSVSRSLPPSGSRVRCPSWVLSWSVLRVSGSSGA
eukprot:8290801-Prorocentrum_lima.AAC.1